MRLSDRSKLCLLAVLIIIMYDNAVRAQPNFRLLFDINLIGYTGEGPEWPSESSITDQGDFLLPDWNNFSMNMYSRFGEYERSIPINLWALVQVKMTDDWYYCLYHRGIEIYSLDGTSADKSQADLFRSEDYKNMMMERDLNVDNEGKIYWYMRKDTERKIHGIIYRIDPHSDVVEPFFTFLDHGLNYHVFQKIEPTNHGTFEVWTRVYVHENKGLNYFELSASGDILQHQVYPDIQSSFVGVTPEGFIVTEQSNLNQIAIYDTSSNLISTLNLNEYYRKIGLNPAAEWKEAGESNPGYIYTGMTRFIQDANDVIYMHTVSTEKQHVTMINTGDYFPDQTRLTRKDIDNKSKPELRILRNAIFARYGRRFHSEDLQEYFERQPWYKQNADYNDSLLTEIDIENIQMIIELEKRL